MVFKAEDWPYEQMAERIWHSLQDYGRIEWKGLTLTLMKGKEVVDFWFESFDNLWGNNRILCSGTGSSLRWLPFRNSSPNLIQ